jgi:hypothetical protein
LTSNSELIKAIYKWDEDENTGTFKIHGEKVIYFTHMPMPLWMN